MGESRRLQAGGGLDSVMRRARLAAVAIVAFLCLAALPQSSLAAYRAPVRRTAQGFEVEPAHARLRVVRGEPVRSRPSLRSKEILRLTPGKYVQVTGSTKYYLQVRLKSGRTGYILPSAVRMITPARKVFRLTLDSPVYQKPNRWAKRVATVHRGRYVNVIGISLNYLKIRMRSGLEGFIPIAAVE